MHHHQDPTVSLPVPQAKSNKDPKDRAYPIPQLEEVYSAIAIQGVRDVFRIRLMTGMHESEIVRVVSGQGEMLVVDDASGIYAVAKFTHKNGRPHAVSLERDT